MRGVPEWVQGEDLARRVLNVILRERQYQRSSIEWELARNQEFGLPHSNRWLALVAIPFLLESCSAGPRSGVVPAPGILPERQELEIWSGGRAATWHSLVITDDSISGVPLRLAPDCAACRLTVARAAVDSVREVHTDKALFTTLGLVGGMAAVVLIAWSAQSD